MAKVLKKYQARAIYDVLCALNSIGTEIKGQILLDGGALTFTKYCYHGGYGFSLHGNRIECCDTQADFAEAYGLK